MPYFFHQTAHSVEYEKDVHTPIERKLSIGGYQKSAVSNQKKKSTFNFDELLKSRA
jgi:hypothetical protein